MENLIDNAEIKELIDNNQYIKDTKSNKKKDKDSLSYLINNYELSQSDSIKLGNGLEKIYNDFIIKFTELKLENIKEKNCKGNKEKDHLYIDNENKIVYYTELKSNLNLDTEKSRSTYTKCIEIKDELQEKFIDYEIKMFLVGLRYYTKDIIPTNIKNKYSIIKDNLLGINEYFQKMNVLLQFNDENDYKLFLEYIVYKMFNK
jgi:hypothetical protein